MIKKIIIGLIFVVSSQLSFVSWTQTTNFTHRLDNSVLATQEYKKSKKEVSQRIVEVTKERYCPSKVRFSSQVSTEDRCAFYIDYIFPLYYSEDETTIVFFNPKKTYFSPYSEELNLGVGLRKIYMDKYILGVHLFYDKKHSPNKEWHYQRGYGFEFLSEPLDFRFNYYDPINDAREVNDGYEFGQANLVYWKEYEEPLEGFDFEFGVPLIPKKLNTRIYAGGFFFDSKMGEDRNGFRVRTETNINNWLSLDLAFNGISGGESEFIGGFRVTIPLELGKILDGRNFLKTRKKSYIKERLFERVVRDIDIQSEASTKREQQEDVEIIYVNNTNTGTEDGTLSNPYNTLTEAFLDSRYAQGKYIYVFEGDGTSAGYIGNYTLLDNVTLWGSGYNGGYEGITTPGYPILDGNDSGNVVTLADNNTVMGLNIQNGDYGVSLTNDSSNAVTATIRNNIFSQHNTSGAYFRNNGDGSISGNILNNEFTSNDIYDIHFYSDTFAHANITSSISGNTLTDVWYLDWVFFGQSGLVTSGAYEENVYTGTVDANHNDVNDISGEASTIGATDHGITKTFGSSADLTVRYDYWTWDYIGFDDPGFDIHIDGASVHSVDAVDINTPLGTNTSTTLDSTGWTDFAQDISGYDSPTITIYTGNTSDSIHESWSYIDSVTVE